MIYALAKDANEINIIVSALVFLVIMPNEISFAHITTGTQLDWTPKWFVFFRAPIPRDSFRQILNLSMLIFNVCF
jgi:hypothetical protein